MDTTRVQKPPYQRGRFRQNQKNMRGRGGRGGSNSSHVMQQLGKGVKNRDKDRKGMNKKWGQGRPQIKIRDASVTVKPDWVTIEEMDFPRLGKLSLPNIKDGEDIVNCGELEYYDKTYDRVNVKNEKSLQSVNRIFHTVSLVLLKCLMQWYVSEDFIYCLYFNLGYYYWWSYHP